MTGASWLPSAAHVGLGHYLVVSALLFTLGLFTIATRRNAVAVLMGVELLLNAAALDFVAFARYADGGVGGQVVAVFIIVVAAAEAAIALAIVLAVFRRFRTIDAHDLSTLRE